MKPTKIRFWNDPAVVGKTPIVTVMLLEGANLGHIYKMWSQQSSLGQNSLSLLAVGVALVFWMNFYRVNCPGEKFAFWATFVGVMLNCSVTATALWFYFSGR